MKLCKECKEDQLLWISSFKHPLTLENSCTISKILSNCKCIVDEEGLHHSFNDESARIDYEGFEAWYKHGIYHRVNGPAFMCLETGVMEWITNDKLHREDGPCTYSTRHEYGTSEHDSWCWHGEYAQEIYEPLYVKKALRFIYRSPPWVKKEKFGVVCEKINKYFYRVLCGNKKILVVDLSSWDAKSVISSQYMSQ